MPASIKLYRIFLASPGGLEDERNLIREEVQFFNETIAIPAGAFFHVVSWETVAGGVGRPQGLINEQLALCDYFFMLLWHKWGSRPAGSSYTSGTEEEFREATRYMDAGTMPMTDLVVCFKIASPPQLSSIATNDLDQINRFRDGLDSLLYRKFKDNTELLHLLRESLAKWLFLGRGSRKGRKRPSSRQQLDIPQFDDPPANSPSVPDRAGSSDEPHSIKDQANRLMSADQLAEAHDLFDRLLSGKYGRVWEAEAYVGIGNVWLLRDQPDRAAENFRAGSRLARALGAKAIEAQSLYLFGRTQYAQRSPRLARSPLVEAERIIETLSDPFGTGEIRNLLGLVCLDLGLNGEARRCFERAIVDYANAKRPDSEAKALNNLGLTDFISGDFRSAKQAFGKALAKNSAQHLGAERALNHFNIGRVAKREGEKSEAKNQFMAAYDLYRGLGMLDEIAKVQIELDGVA